MRRFWIFVFILCAFSACKKSGNESSASQNGESVISLSEANLTYERTIFPEYAKEFRIDVYNLNAENAEVGWSEGIGSAPACGGKTCETGFERVSAKAVPEPFPLCEVENRNNGGVTGAVAPVERGATNEVGARGETSPSLKEKFFLLTIFGTDRYLVVPEGEAVPENLPAGIKIVRLPLKNAYLAATSAMSFFARLDSLGSLAFSSIQKKDWYIEEAARAMESGEIRYAGKYSAPDFEFLLDEKCPLAIESMMISHAPQIKEKLESLGITVFVDKSSYEENPLGRLEWVKVYGILTGKEREAEEFFEREAAKVAKIMEKDVRVAPEHDNLQNESSLRGAQRRNNLFSAGNENLRKTVAFFYVSPNGMAVVRGEDDYIVKMIEMAGGKYLPEKTKKTSSPSVTISMEQFYASCAEADCLIYNSSIDNTIFSKEDLLSKSPLFADFAAFRRGDVWTTGRYLYQATDRIADVVLDLHAIVAGETESLGFLRKVEK